MEKKVILGIADYGNTGIGESIRGPLKHWHEQGHEIWLLALGYNGWRSQVREDIYPYADRIMPIDYQHDEGTKFGQASIERALRYCKADYVMTAFDVGRVRYLCDPHTDPVVSQNPETLNALDQRRRSFTHIAYFPMDGLCADNELPRHFDELIAGMDVPVTYSAYAQRAVLDNIGFAIPMIPIGHDPKIYYKRPREEARAALQFPSGKFIMGMVATNQSRKLWPEFFEATGRVCRRHADAMVLPWTTWHMQISGGFDIGDLVYRADIAHQTIHVGNAVHMFNDNQMADLYSALNVCVLTTVGEGAGLPPIRARACGTPALVSDNSSCTEFASDDFELIPSFKSHTDNGNNLVRFATNVDVLEERLEILYQDWKFAEELGAHGIEHSKQYQHEVVNAEWDMLLERIS